MAMRKRAVFVLLVTSSWPLFASTSPLRRFEVRDSVEMSYFGTRVSSAPGDLDDDGVVAPDGRHFVEVTHRGVLPQGVTEGTIWLFDTAIVQRVIRDAKSEMPKPAPLARMSAAVNGGLGVEVLDAGNTITSPQWSDDGRSVTFLGRNGRANRQLFRVNVGTGAMEALTPSTQDVLTYARSGNAFVYLAGPDADLQAERAWRSAGPEIPDITIGTGTALMPLLYPHFRGNAYGEPIDVELWQVRDDRAAAVVDAASGNTVRLTTKYTSLLVALSPDASRVVTIAVTPEAEYQYRVIDLSSGRSTLLEGVSIAQGRGRYGAAWAPDGTEIALTKVVVAGDRGVSDKPAPCEIALLRIGTSEARCVLRPDPKSDALSAIAWPIAGHIRVRYTVSGQSGYSQRFLRRKGSSWLVDKSVKGGARLPIELRVHQGLNEPPVLVATDTGTGKSRPIFDPNPQLAAIALGTASEYRWKDPRGREILGGLVLPPGFMPGKRYGLVIQTHGFNPQKFFRVGYSDTSNAGRAFTGRDLLVLQVREPRSAEPSWRDGVELGLEVYLAAIDKLAEEGRVDPAKVGISGYSYSGWLVANAITRAPERFAAAAIANSDPVTLTGYYEKVGSPVPQELAKYYVGAKPYGDGLKTWIERAPSFSTDKITAPVLLQPADPWHLIGIWDMYAALFDQGKPVELQYMRSGEHNIRKPLQVLAHQEMLVDWFDFWLNRHEDQDSSKAEQYARWRKLLTATGGRDATQ